MWTPESASVPRPSRDAVWQSSARNFLWVLRGGLKDVVGWRRRGTNECERAGDDSASVSAQWGEGMRHECSLSICACMCVCLYTYMCVSVCLLVKLLGVSCASCCPLMCNRGWRRDRSTSFRNLDAARPVVWPPQRQIRRSSAAPRLVHRHPPRLEGAVACVRLPECMVGSWCVLQSLVCVL